jgi:hypothetical protein
MIPLLGLAWLYAQALPPAVTVFAAVAGHRKVQAQYTVSYTAMDAP